MLNFAELNVIWISCRSSSVFSGLQFFAWKGNMGEIDTKPIEPVQVALSLFGENDQSKRRSSSSAVRFWFLLWYSKFLQVTNCSQVLTKQCFLLSQVVLLLEY